MTPDQLNRLVRLWQKRLRLQDWNVTPILTPEAEMPGLFGDIAPDTDEMTALMRVRDGETAEATVIHELLHLRLWPFSEGDPTEPGHEEKERAINLLADCFLRAYPRRKKRDASPD